FWLWSMQSGLNNAYACIKAFSETDFTEDLQKFDVPTLVLHGEDDQIVPSRTRPGNPPGSSRARRRSTTRVRRTASPPHFKLNSALVCRPASGANDPPRGRPRDDRALRRHHPRGCPPPQPPLARRPGQACESRQRTPESATAAPLSRGRTCAST